MAVTVLQGTFIGASTTKARDLRQSWVGAFSGLSGWTIKDHDYVNVNAERSVIVNDAGFSLMILNSTDTSDLRVSIIFGLEYNDTTHTLTDVAFFGEPSGFSTNNITTTSEAISGYDVNPTGVTSAPIQFSRVHGFHNVGATAGQSDWAVIVSEDYNTAILTMKDGTTNIGKAVYFGEYDNLINNPLLTTDYPYVCSIVSSENHIPSGIIQTVGNASITLQSFRLSARNFFIEQVGSPATPGYADKYSSTPTESRVSPIWFARENPTPINIDANLYGHIIGKYHHIIHARTEGADWGQTVEVDGKIYMLAGKKNGFQTWDSETWWVEIGDSES